MQNGGWSEEFKGFLFTNLRQPMVLSSSQRRQPLL
jgi:hypothetical protein